MDYCNYLLTDINSDQMHRFQNKQTKKIFQWLPVKERIIFKVATFALRFFHGTLQPYPFILSLSTYSESTTLKADFEISVIPVVRQMTWDSFTLFTALRKRSETIKRKSKRFVFNALSKVIAGVNIGREMSDALD